jgi:L-ascorbate metabolism protein UlaG (beta-lactamase superfamily)
VIGVASLDHIPYGRPINEEEDQMRVRWLGWAGVEIEAEGECVVIDPLDDPGATFAALGDDVLERVELPEVVPPASGPAVAGLVRNINGDHTDAAALSAALAPGAAFHEPHWPGGEDFANLAIAQADAELKEAGLDRRAVEPWESLSVGPFTITALPAVDGLGDPQISWLVEAGGARVLHLGDTIFHGYWWRMARRCGPFDLVLSPINGPAVNFPHLQPPSPFAAALEPEQAAVVGELLQARTVVPIHHDGYAVDPWYHPVGDALARFEAAAANRSCEARVLNPGDSLEPLGVPAGS